MAEKYGAPNLCNYYCANECEIGKQYVPEVKVKHLSQIVLEMLASMSSVKKQQDRLIEITADGKIEADEVSSPRRWIGTELSAELYRWGTRCAEHSSADMWNSDSQ